MTNQKTNAEKIKLLEENFAKGEISKETYQILKEKYEKQSLTPPSPPLIYKEKTIYQREKKLSGLWHIILGLILIGISAITYFFPEIPVFFYGIGIVGVIFIIKGVVRAVQDWRLPKKPHLIKRYSSSLRSGVWLASIVVGIVIFCLLISLFFLPWWSITFEGESTQSFGLDTFSTTNHLITSAVFLTIISLSLVAIRGTGLRRIYKILPIILVVLVMILLSAAPYFSEIDRQELVKEKWGEGAPWYEHSESFDIGIQERDDLENCGKNDGMIGVWGFALLFSFILIILMGFLPWQQRLPSPCPFCGRLLRYIELYKKWYCDKCQRYV